MRVSVSLKKKSETLAHKVWFREKGGKEGYAHDRSYSIIFDNEFLERYVFLYARSEKRKKGALL